MQATLVGHGLALARCRPGEVQRYPLEMARVLFFGAIPAVAMRPGSRTSCSKTQGLRGVIFPVAADRLHS